MARRSEHTRDELREMAIAAGYALIAEKGFQSFSARGVAARMGYTVGTLYHLFGTLDEFILHINARTLDEWHDAIIKDMPKRADQRTRYLAHAYLSYARANRNRWSALYEHHMPEGVTVPDWYKPKMDRMFGLVEEALLPGVGGDARAAARLAKVLWASIHGICTLALTGKLTEVKAAAAERMTDDLLALVSGRPLPS
jgi:AcrR family transcriptional regulator